MKNQIGSLVVQLAALMSAIKLKSGRSNSLMRIG